MRALVTGAGGFLGRATVGALRERGHEVRAMVRPGSDRGRLPWGGDVEVCEADLRTSPLEAALEGVDALVHLAARPAGGEDEQFAAAAVATERLLAALDGTSVRRVVLASSFSVYDWRAARGALTEGSPLESDPYARDAYVIAKCWQERIVREDAARSGRELVVLRPGFIWGAGATRLGGMGQTIGPVHLVFGRRTLIPLSYVENCADAFALAAEVPEAAGVTANVIDDEEVTALRYAREYFARGDESARVVAVPYPAALAGVSALDAVARALTDGRANLPFGLSPPRFEARYKPLRFPNDRLRRELGWRQRVSFEAALERAYAP